jgi:hypothetical protein
MCRLEVQNLASFCDTLPGDNGLANRVGELHIQRGCREHACLPSRPEYICHRLPWPLQDPSMSDTSRQALPQFEVKFTVAMHVTSHGAED